MKYLVTHNGLDSDITPIGDVQVASGDHVFDVLGQAKTALSTELRTVRNKYNDAIRRVEAISNRSLADKIAEVQAAEEAEAASSESEPTAA